MAEPAKNGGVQSVGRVLDLLEIVGDAGGEIGLSELAARSGLPLPSIHRLVRTLVQRGYMRQLPNRRYALGARLVPLGQVAGTMLGAWAQPVLTELVDALGESANLAVLDHDAVMYIGQVPSRHTMRMFTEPGPPGPRALHRRRQGAAVAAARRRGARAARPAPGCRPRPRTRSPTPTRCSPSWPRSAARATPWTRASRRSACAASRCRCRARWARSAISVSGPAPRMTPELIDRAVPLLRKAGERLSSEIGERSTRLTGARAPPTLPREPRLQRSHGCRR